MDTLIMLGTLSAYIFSVGAVVHAMAIHSQVSRYSNA